MELFKNYRKDNKLIAEFMEDSLDIHKMEYHISWDWLIPVVQKIEQVNEGVPSELCNLNLYSYQEEVYDAVVEFIKEYNKQYPFQEGDDYWTIEKGRVVWSCWDDISEQIHDDNPNKVYYKSQREAVKQLNKKQ